MNLHYVVMDEQGAFSVTQSPVAGCKVVGMAASEEGARSLMSTVSARKAAKESSAKKRKHG